MSSPLAALLCVALLSSPDDPPEPPPTPQPTVIVVLGVPGSSEYAATHATALQQWREAALQAHAQFLAIGDDTTPTPAAAPTDHDRLRDSLAEYASKFRDTTSGSLWLVLIGHGSFDGRAARFNLRGPDLADTELAQWLRPVPGTVAVLDCTASSAPFLTKLAGPGRVVVTATKSGAEQNYARFGQYLAGVWTDPTSDLDKDGQTSLLEGVVVAARRTGDFYQGKARLSTEHALIDDNADGRGTPADWFRGVRPTRKANDGAPADGRRAHQLHLVRHGADLFLSAEQQRQRTDLETQVDHLLDRKAALNEADYYQQLEALMVQLARTYDQSQPNPGAPLERKP